MKLLKNGDTYSLVSAADIHTQLPAGTYELGWDLFSKSVFLKETSALEIKDKVYDVNKVMRECIVTSFNTYDKNLGCAFKGQKGCGKTIDAKLLAKEANLPVILINQAVPREVDFISTLNHIKQSYTLFVDEFEKRFRKYNGEDEKYHTQESFLSFLDGLDNGFKRLTIFTTNGSLDENLMNRPSRILFYKEYLGISTEFAKMAIDDLLENKEFEADLLKHIDKNNCTIDILCAVIKQINALNKPYSEFKDFFNYKVPTAKYIILGKPVHDEKAEYKEIGVYNDRNSFMEIGESISFVHDNRTQYVDNFKKTNDDEFEAINELHINNRYIPYYLRAKKATEVSPFIF